MNNKYIIDKIQSYNNYYDLENRFPSFIDDKINISNNKVKDLKKLKKEIIYEKKKHDYKCLTKSNCGTSMMYDKSIEIVESCIQNHSDNKLLKFLSKFWWNFIITILTGIVLLIIEKIN